MVGILGLIYSLACIAPQPADIIAYSVCCGPEYLVLKVITLLQTTQSLWAVTVSFRVAIVYSEYGMQWTNPEYLSVVHLLIEC